MTRGVTIELERCKLVRGHQTTLRCGDSWVCVCVVVYCGQVERCHHRMVCVCVYVLK